MGFDINGFKQAFIEKVEKMVNGEDGDFSNGKIDTNLEKSIFTQELNKAIQNGEISEADAKTIFGLELSGAAETRNARRTQGADGRSSDSGQPIVVVVEEGSVATFVIDNSSNWQLTINITAELKDMVQDLINAFKAGFNSINENNNQLFADLKKYLGEESNNIFSFLYALYDVIRKDGELQIDALLAIIDAINANSADIGAKIDKTNALLEALNGMLMDKLDNIAIQIKQVDQNAQKNMQTLINLVVANNEKQDEQNKALSDILNAIKSINGTIKSFSAEQQKQLAAILDLMNTQGAELDANFKQVLGMLEAIKLAQGDNKDVLKNIYDAIKEGNTNLLNALGLINENFSQYGDDIKALLLKIAEKELTVNVTIDGTELVAMLQEIVEKLTNIDKNTGDTANYTKQVIEAIEQLGVDITEALKNIVVKLDPEKMDLLIDLIKQFKKDNSEENKAILNAIAGLGDGMGDILEALKNLNIDVSVDMGPVVRAINANGANLYDKLSDILLGLGTINSNVVEGNDNMKLIATGIINAIANVGTVVDGGGKPYNLDEIMGILREILAAIKDHKVIVTVDENGNIHCGTNEGENNDWNNVLNVRQAADFEDEDPTGVTSAKVDKQSNSPIYDLSGRKVSGPLQPGHIYIQDGKKFVAK